MVDKIDTLLMRNANILVLRDEFVIASEELKTMAAAILQSDYNQYELEEAMDRYDDYVDYTEACGWRYEQALHES